MIDRDQRNDFPDWTPRELADWVSRIRNTWPESEYHVFDRLARDLRMKGAWKWFLRVREQSPRTESCAGFCVSIKQNMQPPGKPGNMPVGEREDYFKKVRKHANALIELLDDTKFDRGTDYGSLIDEDDCVEEFAWARNLPAHVSFYYEIGGFGVTRLPFDFPQSCFVDQLSDLISWTKEPDYWGRGLQSSKSIRQASPGPSAIYFNCTFYESFLRRTGIKIPFEVLANIANVALELPDGEEVSAGTVRKQVTRYLNRVGTPRAHLSGETQY